MNSRMSLHSVLCRLGQNNGDKMQGNKHTEKKKKKRRSRKKPPTLGKGQRRKSEEEFDNKLSRREKFNLLLD